MAAVVEPAKCRVALLAGGTSGEREISLASGKGAGEALREAGVIVQELDPAKKDHLKTLIEEPFDVAFVFMEKVARMACSRDFWKRSVFPTRDQVCGQAQRR